MISRRQIVVGAGSASVAAGMSWAGASFVSAQTRTNATRLSLFLYDHSIDGGAAAAKIAKDSGVNVGAFREDIGIPWLHVIEPMWRQRPRAIAGLTHAGALFCLTQLARSYRMACTFRLGVLSSAANELDAVAVRLLHAATYARPALRDFEQDTDAPLAWLLQPIARNNQ